MINYENLETHFTVASYETDATGKLSLYALFNQFQELAGRHAEQLHVGYELLQQQRLAWVLSRITVHIRHLPDWGMQVQLRTWPKGINKLFALRDFALTDASGNLLVSATSAWLLLDLEKHRPYKIENLERDLQFPNAPHAINEVPGKIQIPETLQYSYQHAIVPSDIDINQHVNNAQYAKWVTDCFPETEFLQQPPQSVQINYLEETLPGDIVQISRLSDTGTAQEYVVTGISQTKGTSLFSAKIVR